MAETYVRDPVALSVTDGFAYSGRTQGFVPLTIFYEEPTGNDAVDIPIAFFQTFGVPHPSEYFVSMDEPVLPEVDEKGECIPREIAVRQTEWCPIWPPLLRLVEIEPEWRSVDFEEDIAKREERRAREEYDRKIAQVCLLCGDKGGSLAIINDPSRMYVHGSKYIHAVPCKADKLHVERETITGWLPSPEQEARRTA